MTKVGLEVNSSSIDWEREVIAHYCCSLSRFSRLRSSSWSKGELEPDDSKVFLSRTRWPGAGMLETRLRYFAGSSVPEADQFFENEDGGLVFRAFLVKGKRATHLTQSLSVQLPLGRENSPRESVTILRLMEDGVVGNRLFFGFQNGAVATGLSDSLATFYFPSSGSAREENCFWSAFDIHPFSEGQSTQGVRFYSQSYRACLKMSLGELGDLDKIVQQRNLKESLFSQFTFELESQQRA